MVRRQAGLYVVLMFAFAGSPSAQAQAQDRTAPPAQERLATLVQPQEVSEDAPAPKTDKLSELDQKLDGLSKNLTVVTADPSIKIVLGQFKF
jgi:hypothetical protein